MVRFNGFCLCLVIFTACYSQNGESKRQFSYNEVNKIYPVVTTERFVHNRQNFVQPNASQQHPVTIKPSPDSVTKLTDHRRDVRTTKLFKHGRRVITSVYGDHVTFPSKEHFNVVTNRYFPNDEVDIVVGTTFLCDSQEDCNGFLNHSFCYWKANNHFVMGICKCKVGHVYDGEKCLELEDVDFCHSHSYCANLPNRRCRYVSSTKSMICLCEKNYVADKRICLAKAAYLGHCVSSKQCPSGTHCLDNICRYPCRSGYIWKIDSCVKELPKTIPAIANNNVILYIIISVVIGMIMVFMFLTVSFLIRRQLLRQRSSPPDNDQLDSTTESSPSTMLTELDQPPSYEDVMTASTLTLATNAQEISEEPPPSYKYWEQDLQIACRPRRPV